ncbi:MAG: polysaccharide biosynthesis protein CapD [Noviherbaspirillum sp.]|nr:polysaccharide biosynthesis protein CapD [Noviherbaspirillum sp.]
MPPVIGLSGVLLALPRSVKRIVALTFDMALCAVSVWVAFGLRLDTWGVLSGVQWVPVFVSWVFSLPLFISSGMYRAIFRYSGYRAAVALGKTLAIYGVLFAAVFTFLKISGVPRTIGIIQPLVLTMLMVGSRLGVRYWLGGQYRNRIEEGLLPKVLIYGAGSAGQQVAGVLSSSREMKAVGFVDDSPALQGHTINGLRVFNPRSLESVVARFGITDLLLAIPSASRARRNEILQAVQPLSLKVRTLPGLMDIAHGRVQAADIRDLEIEDLLGRDPVAPNALLLNKNILNKVVLVTGAGGSIGSELCRQIAKLKPSTLLLVESSEFALYSIHQTLLNLQADENASRVKIIPLLASVRDYECIENIMRTWHPHTVYHAAAFKHVPLVEHNPAEGIRNNVLGTLHTARAAGENNVSDFVLISTDKAVRPTNIMGASKRLAEMVLQGLASTGSHGYTTRFSMVRFGNVLGSSGSVVPLFRRQIKKGGPITITHAEVTRYFMTIPEAAQLVIQAGAMAGGGDVFVLAMGEPVRILDLAQRMITLSGLTVKDAGNPEGDIEIVVTGMRPGEKLYEELLIGDNPEPTQHSRIMKAHETHLPWAQLAERLSVLEVALGLNDVGIIRRMLKELVTGYRPVGEIVDWTHLEYMEELLEEEGIG